MRVIGGVADESFMVRVDGVNRLRGGRRRRWRCAAIAFTLAVACDGSPEPTSPSPPPAPSPQRVVTEIRGVVSDTAFRRLAGARVEIQSGPGAGTVAITDTPGEVVITGEFSGVLTLGATKAGFLPATTQLNIQALCERCAPKFSLALESVDPIVTFEPGNYTLTFTADPACTRLPVEARHRTYAAIVTRATGDYTGSYDVRVPAVGLHTFHNSFLLGISGAYLATDDYAAPTFFERMTANTYVAIDFLIGTTTFDVVSSSGVSIPYAGSFEYCSVRPGVGPEYCDRVPAESLIEYELCFADHHRMVLRRE